MSTVSKKRGLAGRIFGRWKVIVTLGVLCAAAIDMPELPRLLIDPAISNVLTADYAGASAGDPAACAWIF